MSIENALCHGNEEVEPGDYVGNVEEDEAGRNDHEDNTDAIKSLEASLKHLDYFLLIEIVLFRRLLVKSVFPIDDYDFICVSNGVF